MPRDLGRAGALGNAEPRLELAFRSRQRPRQAWTDSCACVLTEGAVEQRENIGPSRGMLETYYGGGSENEAASMGPTTGWMLHDYSCG